MPRRSSETFNLCLIGGGPNALYMLERVLARALADPSGLAGLAIHIFDKDGHFGSGCHYSTQPKTNHLNRIAAQIAFAADASNQAQVEFLLPQQVQLTLFDWCLRRFKETGEERYNVSEHAWVERALFGEASESMFKAYVEQIKATGTAVYLHAAEVVDVEAVGEQLLLHSRSAANGTEAEQTTADFIVLCTGHGEGHAASLLPGSSLAATQGYINHIYPLERIDSLAVPSGSGLACRGLGLAAIDLILWLTEGRGGYFSTKTADGRLLDYHPSGFEPARIFPFSGSGAFPMTRARNQKLDDPNLLHRSLVLSYAAIDTLRISRGRPAVIPHVGTVAQIDFEADILPLMVLEMALVYYRTLYGAQWLDRVLLQIAPRVESHLHGRTDPGLPGVSLASLLEPVEQAAQLTAAALASLLAGGAASPNQELRLALPCFVRVVQGQEAEAGLSQLVDDAQFAKQARDSLDRASPWGHSSDPREHSFSWDRLCDPLAGHAGLSPMNRHDAAVEHLRRDILQAEQGNLENPTKAAIDGVCRDIRDVLRYAVEFGGLTAGSQAIFATRYQRLLNRIAVGTSLKIMTKILAVAEHGVVYLSHSRSPDHVWDGERGWHLQVGGQAKTDIAVQTMVDARVHLFELDTSASELFRNLTRRQLVRRWRNPDPEGNHFYAGGLDIVPKCNLVIDGAGRINPNIAALGVPTDGPHYFHIAAQRPYCGDPVIVDAENVLKAALKQMHGASSPLEPAGAS